MSARLGLGLLIGLALVASVTLPLLTYSVTLAVFGTAHVATELRYVDRRFGGRLVGVWGAAVAGLLGGVVLTRVGPKLGWFDAPAGQEAELALVVVLAGLVVPWTAKASGLAAGTAALVAVALLLGVSFSPMHTLLFLACLHNWTPLGFLAEARRAWLPGAVAVFLGLPLLVATGLPAAAAEAVGLWHPDLTVLPTGPLGKQLGAYLPPAWHDAPWATHAFSALVLAQCLHYIAVIGVLPAIQPGPEAGAAWIGRVPVGAFVGGVVALCALGLVGYAADFGVARGWYGVAAAVHAWLEVPVLLVALGGAAVPGAVVPPSTLR